MAVCDASKGKKLDQRRVNVRQNSITNGNRCPGIFCTFVKRLLNMEAESGELGCGMQSSH